jgi:hypothetical protein
MTCGGMTEIGPGYPDLPVIKMEIMVLKECHHRPIFLVAEDLHPIGLIKMVIFGYLADITTEVILHLFIFVS